MHHRFSKKMAKINIIGFFAIFAFVPFAASAAANLSLSPSSGSYEVGDVVSIRVLVSGDAPLNAISGNIVIPSNLGVQSISKAASMLNFWATEPVYSRDTSSIKFEGVALGGAGTSGTVITVYAKALKSGKAAVTFQSGQVLANDGEGTNITGNLSGATYTINEATEKPAPTKAAPTPKGTVVKVEPTPVPPPTALPALTAPEIILGTKYGTPAIIGTSQYPNDQVVLTFMAENGVKVFITGSSDNLGDFYLNIPDLLKRGIYNVSAVMVRDDMTSSPVSNVISLQIGNALVDYLKIIWPYVLIIILLAVYLAFHKQVHAKKHKNNAISIVSKSFDLLRVDLAEYKQSKLTLGAHKVIDGIEKDIDDAEKLINKEIKGIE